VVGFGEADHHGSEAAASGIDMPHVREVEVNAGSRDEHQIGVVVQDHCELRTVPIAGQEQRCDRVVEGCRMS